MFIYLKSNYCLPNDCAYQNSNIDKPFLLMYHGCSFQSNGQTLHLKLNTGNGGGTMGRGKTALIAQASSKSQIKSAEEVEDFMNVMGIVKVYAGKFSANNTYNSDDIQQELLCHLWYKKNKLYYNGKIHWGKVKIACQNKVTDIVRGSAVRNHMNVEINIGQKEKEEIFELLEFNAQGFSANFVSNPHAESEHQDLVYHIIDYAHTQGPRVVGFLTEFINPSDPVLNEFRVMTDKFPTYRKYHFIPPHSLGKILNYSTREVGQIMDNLKCYLETLQLA